MTLSPKSNDRLTDLPRQSAVTLLITTIADTTWRMFVPTIGGTILGIWLDHSFDVAPLWTIVMVSIGFLATVLLIALQIRNLRKK